MDKWNRQDDGAAKTKNMCVCVDWMERSTVSQLERAAPTQIQETILVILQWLGSAKVSGLVTDLTDVFAQNIGARVRAKRYLGPTCTILL